MQHRVPGLCRTLLFLLVLVNLCWPLTAQAAGVEQDVPALFRHFYERNGGDAIFGSPLSGDFALDGLRVQYFERLRLEWHPEFRGTENEVLVSALGREASAARTFSQSGPQPGAIYFQQTGHNIQGGFARFWLAHNGQRLFGYPLSDELQERDAATNQPYTVQYFERVRLEWHPGQAQVTLAPLGSTYYAEDSLRIQSTAVGLSTNERRVFEILMAARGTTGLLAPQLDPALIEIARARSADMATRGYFSHYTPEGATIFTLLDAAEVQWSTAGEIISRNNYATEQTAEVAGTAYLASPPHRAVVMDPQYNAVGVGHSVAQNGMHYYTVVFVRR